MLNAYGILEGSHFLFSHPYTLNCVHSKSSGYKEKWIKHVQDVSTYYGEPDDLIIRQFRSQQEYMHNYLLINGNFTFVTAHNSPVAVKEHPITQEYLVDAISTYLAKFGYPPSEFLHVVINEQLGKNYKWLFGREFTHWTMESVPVQTMLLFE